jgi:glycosyltransferase involved in cell wall biosynthesis
LFPTRYPAESWGIVLNEAFAAGAPVITFDRGCTCDVVGEQAGLVVPRSGEYVAAAARQIEEWIADPVAYRAASQAAIERARFLCQQGEEQLERLVQHMFSPLSE